MECCICAEQFTSSGEHIPLLLSCGHSTCKACVHFCITTTTTTTNSNPNTFVCAVCKQQSPLSQHQADGEVDGGLPINQILVGMICSTHNSNTQQQQQHVDDVGVLCECGKNKATLFCANCDVNFCGECFDHAHVHPKMKQHTSTQLSNKPLVLCTQHNKTLDTFCNTCDKPICLVCSLGDCKQHSSVPIADKATESKDKVTALVAQLAECAHNLTNKTKEIESALAWDIKRHECMISSVQQAIAQVRRTLDECEERIVDRIKHVQNSAVKSLQLHSDHISAIAQCVGFVSESCKQATANANNSKTNSFEVSVALASCVAQANSVLTQSAQLCAMPVITTLSKLRLSNQLQQQVAKFVQQIEHDVQFSRVIVDYGKIAWSKSKCVAKFDGTAELYWEIAEESGEATTDHQAIDGVEFQVLMVGGGSQPQLHAQAQQRQAPAGVVYRGKEMHCNIDGLGCGGEAVFELGVCFDGHFVFVGCDPLTLAIPKFLLRFVEADPAGGLTINEDGSHVFHSAAGYCQRYCFGDEIPRGGVVRWGVRVTTSPREPWVFVGIISQNTSASESFMSQSSFGWARDDYEIRDGRSANGGSNWQSGDTAILTLDMDNNTLELAHHRTNSIRTLDITPNTTWRVHVNLGFVGSAVELFAV